MDSPNAPLFSIITVCFNAAGSIRRTLSSVAEQTCRLFEYIVVDGGSSDSTTEIVSNAGIPQLRLVSEKDNGIYDAMNKGLSMATGEYVIFLNAGDSFHSPDTLAILADAAMNNDFPGIIYGQTDIVDASGRRLGERHLRAPEVLTLDSFKNGMVVCHQAFVALRKLTHFFNLRYRFSADYEWCIRCLQHSRHNVYVDRVLIDYLYEGATTRNRGRSLRERFRIMCYYYGTLPTIFRHLSFLPRFIMRRRSEKKFNGR